MVVTILENRASIRSGPFSETRQYTSSQSAFLGENIYPYKEFVIDLTGL